MAEFTPVNLKAIKDRLVQVENPARYVAAEYFYNRKSPEGKAVKACIGFADLYEIGMANNAVRIMYDLLNRIPDVFCDRVFSVAPDFEKVLRDTSTPLFSIGDHLRLKDFDFIGISTGSELGATDILQIIDLGGMSIYKDKREESDPVIILGGPAMTNPVPFGDFADFVFIGEAEAGMSDIVDILRQYRSRSERIEKLSELPFLWYKGKKKAVRAVDASFAETEKNYKYYVLPAFKISQDNGNVEVMRGCPNGCRFCHAGQYYKPYRQRSIKTIYNLVKQSVDEFGYREITLASLSSGDYPRLDSLINVLNHDFASKEISFSLPSLKVSSFSLDILDQISQVRKSGLTFAIETPIEEWQHSLNKEVRAEQIIEIIQQAKARGWKLAKFYFMVGLPFTDPETEATAICEFLTKIHRATRINMNINIGTFIPKAHTPFQWAPQMRLESSDAQLRKIKQLLKDSIKGIKVSYHEPYTSYLEGLISRGDEKTGELIAKAYEMGARLDAWGEGLNREIWDNAKKCFPDTDFERCIYKEYSLDEDLPWSSVSMNVGDGYLKKEYENARDRLLTSRCIPSCDHKCGVCNKNTKVVEQDNDDDGFKEEILNSAIPEKKLPTDLRQVIFEYEKTGKAVYLSHINTLRAFEHAFQRSGLPIQFTQGFNPKPRLEFLNPLSLGAEGSHELMLFEIDYFGLDEQKIIDAFNSKVCEGIKVNKATVSGTIGINDKKWSLASRMKESVFEFSEFRDKQLIADLKNYIDTDPDVKIINYNDSKFILRVQGEKNLFKAVFPETDKFRVLGNCTMRRLALNLVDYTTPTNYDGLFYDRF